MMLAGLLGVPPQTDVLFVRRLRLADDEPMAVEDLHVPVTVAPGLTGEDLEGRSFYDLLAERYDNPVVAGTQTVEPALVTDDVAGLLGVATGTPVFLFERTSRVAAAGSPSSSARPTAGTATGSSSTSSRRRARPGSGS